MQITLRFEAGVDGVDGLFEGRTLKNESSRPWVCPVFALHNFLAPERIRSSLKFLSPHKNLTRPSSSG